METRSEYVELFRKIRRESPNRNEAMINFMFEVGLLPIDDQQMVEQDFCKAVDATGNLGYAGRYFINLVNRLGYKIVRDKSIPVATNIEPITN